MKKKYRNYHNNYKLGVLKSLDDFIQEALNKYECKEIDQSIYEATGKWTNYLITTKYYTPDLVKYNQTFNKNDCFYNYTGHYFNKFPRTKFTINDNSNYANENKNDTKEENEQNNKDNIETNEKKKEENIEEKDKEIISKIKEIVKEIVKESESEPQGNANNEEEIYEEKIVNKEEENTDKNSEPKHEDKILTNPNLFFKLQNNDLCQNKSDIDNLNNNNENKTLKQKEKNNEVNNNKKNISKSINKNNLQEETEVLTFSISGNQSDNNNKNNKNDENTIDNNNNQKENNENKINQNADNQITKQQLSLEITKENVSEVIKGEQKNSNQTAVINSANNNDNNTSKSDKNQINNLNNQNINNNNSFPFMTPPPYILYPMPPPQFPLNFGMINPLLQPPFPPNPLNILPSMNAVLPQEIEGDDDDDSDPIYNFFNEDYSKYNSIVFLEKPVLIVKKNMIDKNWFVMNNNKIYKNFNSEELLYFLGEEIKNGNTFENMTVNDFQTDVFFKPNNLFDILRKSVPKLKKKMIQQKIYNLAMGIPSNQNLNINLINNNNKNENVRNKGNEKMRNKFTINNNSNNSYNNKNKFNYNSKKNNDKFYNNKFSGNFK